MFGTTLTVACTVMHVYVFWRITSVPVVKSRIPRKYVIAAALVLWTVFLAGRNLGRGSEGAPAATLELLGMNWLASLFLIFVSLLAVDTVTGFGWILPRLAPSMRGWAVLAGMALAALANVQGLRAPEVVRHDVVLPGLPEELDGTVLVGVADMHLGSLIGRAWLEERITQIIEEKPDLVVFLGDIFEGHGFPQETFLPHLRRLTPRMGVWCVPGNHGSRTSMRIMSKAGFHPLEGAWREVRPGLVLGGVPARHRGSTREHTVTEVLAGRPPGATILLAHKPEYAYAEAAAEAGAALFLSGHTHGGQVWPFDYLVRYAYPLLEGRYDVNGTTVIVSRGAGTWGPRMRLWARGEILRITLHACESRRP